MHFYLQEGLNIFYLMLSTLWEVPCELWMSLSISPAQITDKCSLDLCLPFNTYIFFLSYKYGD